MSLVAVTFSIDRTVRRDDSHVLHVGVLVPFMGQKPRVRHLLLGLTRRAGVLADLEDFLPESQMDRGEEQGLHFGWNLVKWIKEVANELANAG
jgi:hypothetical protein